PQGHREDDQGTAGTCLRTVRHGLYGRNVPRRDGCGWLQDDRKRVERLGRGRGKLADDCGVYGALGNGGKSERPRSGDAMDQVEEGTRRIVWLVYLFGARRH